MNPACTLIEGYYSRVWFAHIFQKAEQQSGSQIWNVCPILWEYLSRAHKSFRGELTLEFAQVDQTMVSDDPERHEQVSLEKYPLITKAAYKRRAFKLTVRWKYENKIVLNCTAKSNLTVIQKWQQTLLKSITIWGLEAT